MVYVFILLFTSSCERTSTVKLSPSNMVISLLDLRAKFLKKDGNLLDKKLLLDLKHKNKQNLELLLYLDQALILINGDESLEKRHNKIYSITQSSNFQDYSPFLKYTYFNSLYLIDYELNHYLEAIDQMIMSASVIEKFPELFNTILVKVYFRIGYVSSYHLGAVEKAIIAYEVALNYSITSDDIRNQHKLLYNISLLEYEKKNYLSSVQKGLDAITALKNITPLNYNVLWRNLYPTYIQSLVKLNDTVEIRTLYDKSLHELRIGNIDQEIFDEFIHSILYSLVLVGMDEEFNFQVNRFSDLENNDCENKYILLNVYKSLALYNKLYNPGYEREVLILHLENSKCGLDNKYYRKEYLNTLDRLIELDSENKDLVSLNGWLEKRHIYKENKNETFLNQTKFWNQKKINFLEQKANDNLEKFNLSKLLSLSLMILLGLVVFIVWRIRVYNNELRSKKEALGKLNSSLHSKNIELNENIELSNKQKVEIHLKNEALKNTNIIINEKNVELSVELKAQLLFTSNSIKVFNNLVGQIDAKVENDKARTFLKKIIKENLNENIWSEVDHKFLQVNESFFNVLSKKFPILTNNDMKLCALLRMNLSNKEISRIQYISADSVKVAKFRLKKKLNITDTNLITFLNNISDVEDTRL